MPFTSNMGSNEGIVEKPDLMPMAPPAPKRSPVPKAEAKKPASAVQTNKRRSTAVTEVERLKDNREKRRAQQAQVYEAQEKLKSKGKKVQQ